MPPTEPATAAMRPRARKVVRATGAPVAAPAQTLRASSHRYCGLAMAGDLDGDGFVDLAIGLPAASDGAGEVRGFAVRALAARPGDVYLTRLVATLGAGAGLDGIADPRERAFVRARVMLDLHAPAEAMAALAVFGDDAPPPIVMLRARAAVADGRVSEAVALVEAARSRDPAHVAEWDRVLAQLRALHTGR